MATAWTPPRAAGPAASEDLQHSWRRISVPILTPPLNFLAASRNPGAVCREWIVATPAQLSFSGLYSMMNIKMGGAIASAAAMLAINAFAGGALAQDNKPAGSSGIAVKATDTVHCYGVNTCSGTADWTRS